MAVRDDVLQIALVARRYYLDGRTKSEIAEEFKLSRFKVARLLETGREQGIIRIEIDVPPAVDAELAQELERRLPIDRAVVVTTAADSKEEELHQLARVAATVLADSIQVGDVLGISWGRTLDAVVGALPELPTCDVVQLAGGLPSAQPTMSGVDLVRRAAVRAHGHLYPLHAPLVVRDSTMAADLRAEPPIAYTLEKFAEVTIALVGIGSWQGTGANSALRAALMPDDALLKDQDICADVCCSLLDAQGQPIHPELQSRAMSITLDQLRAVPRVIAVAGGREKAAAVRAAALARCAHTFVTTDTAAEAIIASIASDGEAAE